MYLQWCIKINRSVNRFRPEIHLNNTPKFSFYLSVNTLHLHYKSQLINGAVWQDSLWLGYSRCSTGLCGGITLCFEG